jgi:hypothetical protein
MNVIPGTNVLFAGYRPTGQRPPLRDAAEAAQRRGLLAKVHIAKKDMGLNSGEYEAILAGFRVASAGELSIPQLERLVKYLEKLGWKQVRRLRRKDGDDALLLAALRRRCVEIARTIDNGERRLAGLALKICGVSSLTWCRDAAKLERLLAVLGNIKE